MLYIVATPIGNREDITLRALATLFSVDVLLCEDTRKTGLLLSRYENEEPYGKIIQIILPGGGKKPRLISFYDEVEDQKIPDVIDLLKEGKSVALVSDSGTPLISDPGFKLVRACRREGILVSPVPGPSSIIAALSVAGLPTDRFLFLGYVPEKEGKREKLFEKLRQQDTVKTVVFLESPYRIRKTLAAVEKVLGNIPIVVSREMTKVHEEIVPGLITEILPKLQNPKGEYVLIFSV
jgi:16S rRNA (cytidine1402-2'-O)-methyltransferase